MAQRVRRLPAMRETWVRPLCWEDPLEKEMADHSSTLAWKIPCIVWNTSGLPTSLTYIVPTCQRLFTLETCCGYGYGNPDPEAGRLRQLSPQPRRLHWGVLGVDLWEPHRAGVSLLHGWRSLVGYSPWGHKELDVTEQHSQNLQISNQHMYILKWTLSKKK